MPNIGRPLPYYLNSCFHVLLLHTMYYYKVFFTTNCWQTKASLVVVFFSSVSQAIKHSKEGGGVKQSYFKTVLIHSADPQSLVIIVFAHVVRPSVSLHFSKSSKTKQISSKNDVRSWRERGSVRVDP